MTDSPVRSQRFILSAFDREMWCPVFQVAFQVTELDALRAILGNASAKDFELNHQYWLDETELEAVRARFSLAFEPQALAAKDITACLFRPRGIDSAPYLIHTGYELPLLLDGRKKLARISHEYPPMTFEGEDRFDHWVAARVLHREEVVEPFERKLDGRSLGIRTIYYTTIGEEWRIPAMKLIMHAFGKSGGWNEHFERLEGMLFGYEDWQNNWWIEQWRRRRP